MSCLPKGTWSIGLSKTLKNTPQKVKLQGKSYVMYRKQDNHVVLMDNVCPHRGADLSSGQVVNDCIRCPYHGWEFDSTGSLTRVPSSTNKPPKCPKLKSHTIVENGGFIWAVDGTMPVDYCDELVDPTWKHLYGSKIVEGNVTEWLMNESDISHINFVHDFADEDNSVVNDIKIVIEENYIDCFAVVQPKAINSLTQHMQPTSSTGSCVQTRFIASSTAVVRIKLSEPYEFITYTNVTPIDERHTLMTWCIMYQPNSVMNLPFVDAILNHEMYKTIAQDESIIKNITPLKEYNINVAADKFQLRCMFLD